MNRLFYIKFKNVSCDYNREWLKLIPQLNETVKQDKIREEPENRLLPCALSMVEIEHCFQRYALAVKGAWPCRGGGIAASTLFQQADVGKIPATVKHKLQT